MEAKKALFWEQAKEGRVKCNLCPHGCNIAQGKTGICGVRHNDGGELVTLNYGKVSSLALDPVEKKPLYRFYPGSFVLSAGSFGCNFRCGFCQNWPISQKVPPVRDMTPGELVSLASELVPRGNIGLAYTYNEPTIWYEFVYDCARLAHGRGLKNALVTNGYIQKEPLKALLPYIDAMNIDVKSMSDGFYRDLCSGTLGPVLETVRESAKACHVEVTNLVIPGRNDSEEEADKLAEFIASVSPEIPLHFTRYHPDFTMREPPATPRETVIRLAEIAKRRLRYVYCGNM